MKLIVVIGIVVIVLTLIWIIGQYIYVKYFIEKPSYSVESKHDGYQIRQYEPYVVASTVVPDNDQALNKGFSVVANYIFGGNTQNNKVAMTSPVLDERTSETISMTSPVTDQRDGKGNRTVSFIMPSEYSLETLPEPNSDKVVIEEVPAKRYAVIQFSGNYSDKTKEKYYKKLVSMLERDRIEYTSTWKSAGYDPPFTLPILKRNEVWIEL